MVKQTFLGTIRTMQDDIKGAPQKSLEYSDQPDSMAVPAPKKTPEPPHFKPRPTPLPVHSLPTEETTKPPILKSSPTPLPPLPQIKLEAQPTTTHATPPINLPFQKKSSRDILDELLPMEDNEFASTQPQKIVLPGTEKEEERIEQEIFPSPNFPKEETPEQLLGLGDIGEINDIERTLEVPIVPSATPLRPIPAPIPPKAPAPMLPTQNTPTPPLLTTTKMKRKKIFLSKTILLTTSFVVIGAVLVGGGLYFIFSNKDDSQVSQEPEKIDTEKTEDLDLTPPKALVSPDFILENIVVQDALKNTLLGMFDDLKQANFTKNTITYVPIRLKGVVVDRKAQFLKLQTFFSGLDIAYPKELFDAVESNFMLYIYSPGDEERIACQNNLVSEEECYGPRLGIVIQAQEGKQEQLTKLMTEWTDVAKTSGLEQFVLNSLTKLPSETVFEQGVYKSTNVPSAPEVAVHYMNLQMAKYNNLGLSGTALDFAVLGNKLILATSKNSMRKIIDYILAE